MADPEPGSRTGERDPVAAAIGNASLLGVGYVLLGRRNLASGTGVGTLVLLLVLGLSGWAGAEILVLLWWLAMIAHGWMLAGGHRSPVRDPRGRRIAAAAAAVVLLGVTLLRIDAATTADAVDDARARGDCPRAERALDGVWLGPRLADSPAAARGDDTAEACTLSAAAQTGLDRSLGGDLGSLGSAYERLGRAQRLLPGHERMVEVTFDGFLARLAGGKQCGAVEVTAWFRGRPPPHPSLGRAVDAATAYAPAALVGCGDELRADSDWAGATARYQEALRQSPSAPLAGRAKLGIADAAAGRARTDTQAKLRSCCANPFPYPAAPATGPGSRTFVDDSGYDPTANPLYDPLPLPDRQRAADAATAATVVCVGARERGSVARTCGYQNLPSRATQDVSFHRVAIPVQVHEVRTGRLLLDRRVEIDGASCPPTLEYSTFGYPGSGAPSDQDVTVSDADVVAALRGVVLPLLN